MFYAGEDDGRRISIRAFRYIYGPFVYILLAVPYAEAASAWSKWMSNPNLATTFLPALGQSVAKDVVGDV